MFNIFKKLRRKKAGKPKRNNVLMGKNIDLLQTAKSVEHIIDSLAFKIFEDYQATLLKNDITFIVPAIWGAGKNNRINAVQAEIHIVSRDKIESAVELLSFEGIDPVKKFALGYLVRSLIISKIVYMVEAARRRRVEIGMLADSVLANSEPAGTA